MYGFLKDKNMSRIGKKPIIVPQNVKTKVDGNKIKIYDGICQIGFG